MKKEKSFTLIELILVISVILILAAIAIPNFYKTKQRVIEKEGKVNIRLIAAAEKIYELQYRTYWNCTDASACNDQLKLMLPTTKWNYTVTDSSATTVKITAASQTPGVTCTYTTTQDTFDIEPTAAGDCI